MVKAGARWLGVTSVEEGVAARAVCPDVQILVISGVFRGQGSDVAQNRLTVVAWEPWHLDELENAGAEAGQIPVHLEIDTGMSRQGADPNELTSLLARFGRGSALRLDGVMTHLFAADEADGAVTQDQLARLEVALDHVKAAGLKPAWLNVGNSAALLSGQAAAIGALAERFGMKAMVRPGLALYGLAPEFDPAFEGGEPASLVAAHEPVAARADVEDKDCRRARGCCGHSGGLQRDICGDGADEAGAARRRAMPTGLIADLAIGSACWCAGSARRWWAASAWTRRCWT